MKRWFQDLRDRFLIWIGIIPSVIVVNINHDQDLVKSIEMAIEQRKSKFQDIEIKVRSNPISSPDYSHLIFIKEEEEITND